MYFCTTYSCLILNHLYTRCQALFNYASRTCCVHIKVMIKFMMNICIICHSVVAEAACGNSGDESCNDLIDVSQCDAGKMC